MPGFLDKGRTVARPGFSRWLIPPSGLATHRCIGQHELRAALALFP